jgi:hypothetical protein
MRYNEQLHREKPGITCTRVGLIEESANQWRGVALLSNGERKNVTATMGVGGLTWQVTQP